MADPEEETSDQEGKGMSDLEEAEAPDSEKETSDSKEVKTKTLVLKKSTESYSPAIVENGRAELKNDLIVVSWQYPKEDADVEYHVETSCDDQPTGGVTICKEPRCEIKVLLPSTAYCFKIWVVNSKGIAGQAMFTNEVVSCPLPVRNLHLVFVSDEISDPSSESSVIGKEITEEPISKSFSEEITPEGGIITVAGCSIQFRPRTFTMTTRVSGKVEIDQRKWPANYTGITALFYIYTVHNLSMPAIVRMKSWCAPGLSKEGKAIMAHVLHFREDIESWEVLEELPLNDEYVFQFECKKFSPVQVAIRDDQRGQERFLLESKIYTRHNTFCVVCFLQHDLLRLQLGDNLKECDYRPKLPFTPVLVMINDNVRFLLVCASPPTFAFSSNEPLNFMVDESFLRKKYCLMNAVLTKNTNEPIRERLEIRARIEDGDQNLLDGPHSFYYEWEELMHDDEETRKRKLEFQEPQQKRTKITELPSEQHIEQQHPSTSRHTLNVGGQMPEDVQHGNVVSQQSEDPGATSHAHLLQHAQLMQHQQQPSPLQACTVMPENTRTPRKIHPTRKLKQPDHQQPPPIGGATATGSQPVFVQHENNFPSGSTSFSTEHMMSHRGFQPSAYEREARQAVPVLGPSDFPGFTPQPEQVPPTGYLQQHYPGLERLENQRRPGMPPTRGLGQQRLPYEASSYPEIQTQQYTDIQALGYPTGIRPRYPEPVLQQEGHPSTVHSQLSSQYSKMLTGENIFIPQRPETYLGPPGGYAPPYSAQHQLPGHPFGAQQMQAPSVNMQQQMLHQRQRRSATPEQQTPTSGRMRTKPGAQSPGYLEYPRRRERHPSMINPQLSSQYPQTGEMHIQQGTPSPGYLGYAPWQGEYPSMSSQQVSSQYSQMQIQQGAQSPGYLGYAPGQGRHPSAIHPQLSAELLQIPMREMYSQQRREIQIPMHLGLPRGRQPPQETQHPFHPVGSQHMQVPGMQEAFMDPRLMQLGREYLSLAAQGLLPYTGGGAARAGQSGSMGLPPHLLGNPGFAPMFQGHTSQTTVPHESAGTETIPKAPIDMPLQLEHVLLVPEPQLVVEGPRIIATWDAPVDNHRLTYCVNIYCNDMLCELQPMRTPDTRIEYPIKPSCKYRCEVWAVNSRGAESEKTWSNPVQTPGTQASAPSRNEERREATQLQQALLSGSAGSTVTFHRSQIYIGGGPQQQQPGPSVSAAPSTTSASAPTTGASQQQQGPSVSAAPSTTSASAPIGTPHREPPNPGTSAAAMSSSSTRGAAGGQRAFLDVTTAVTNIQVTRSTNEAYTAHLRDNRIYPIVRHRRKGRVLIINNEFLGTPQHRLGSEVDVRNLEELWTELGFAVVPALNLTAEQMLKTCRQFAQQTRNVSVVVVIIMSHGFKAERREYFLGEDEGRAYVDDIILFFNATESPHLRGIPKLFLFQACRGPERDIVADAQAEVQPLPEPPFFQERSDMLVSFPTLSGNTALRNIHTGSWHMNAITHVFMQHAHDTHVLDMLTMVNNAVGRRIAEHRQIQSSNQLNYFRRSLFLFPGWPN